VSAEELEALLIVQEHDIARDRLRHRRVALPERAELESVATQLRATDAQAGDVRGERDRVLADERKLDDEARSIGAHADDADKRLYSGTLASPRELQALQADIEMLRKQRSQIEDRELEVMETREALDVRLASLDERAAQLGAENVRLQASIAASEQEIDAELAEEDAAWNAAAASVPEALMADYQRRRAQNRGAGAEVAYCDNCGAILVP